MAKMIWDSPGALGAELSRLRRRVRGLEHENEELRAEYRAAISQLSDRLDAMAGALSLPSDSAGHDGQGEPG